MNDEPISGIDPFDDVVETGDFDEVDQSDSGEDSGVDETDSDGSSEDSTEAVGEESGEADEIDETEPEEEETEQDVQDDEGEEKPDEESDSEGDEESPEDEISVDGLNKKIESGELEVQIDEETQVTLKDLKNDYIGQKEISRRFTDLDREKKQVDTDVEEINGYINDFAGKMREGDSVGAMQYLAEFAGIAPYMVKAQLIEALRPEIIRMSHLSETQIQNEYLNEQNQYLQQTNESEQQRMQHEQTQRELSQHVEGLRETHGIDEQTWLEAEKAIVESSEKGEEVTPELIADSIKYDRMYVKAESVISTMTDNLENATEWKEQLVDVQEKYPNFTEEDLQEVLKNAMDQVQKSSTEQKLAKKVEAKQAKTKEKTQHQSEPQSEIDEDLEDWFL